MTAPLLEVEGLTVAYRRASEWGTAVSNVSLGIGGGEAYGLVGESGSGKTTLALAVMRYLPRNSRIDAGAIRLDGEDLTRLEGDALRRWRGARLAMVYQDPAGALNPALRVGDQLAEVYRFHRGAGRREAVRRAADALAKVAMPDPEDILRRYPHQLSGGQQQRVVIAMALAGSPRLLILDEPTTGLDVTIEAEIIDLIAALRAEIDASILLISHNLALVSRMCDRIGIMYAGRIVEEGPAHDVLHAPRHPYTMGLLRCVPRFERGKGRVRLEPIPGPLPFLGDAISGCAFHPRCVLAQERCRGREPDLYDVGPGRQSRCYFWEDVPTMPHTYPAAVPSVGEKSDETLLKVSGVRKTFHGRRHDTVAVDDVSFEIGKQETLGLVGESGSGKTTLARCLVGLTVPDSGALIFAGKPEPWQGSRRGLHVLQAMQMVFQNPDTTLNPSWTIRRILARAVQVLLHLGGRARQRRVNDLARQVRLELRYLDLRAAQLSGGLRQRAAIARAVAGKPALAVCDEPVSALDVSVQAAILGLLEELQATEGVSYILISHDLAVVRYLAARIGVMYMAQLVEVGDTEAIFAGPKHPYTEALLSAIPTINGDEARPRIRLGSDIPSLAHPPSGCRFHTRCHRKVGAICEREQPPWQDAGQGHLIRCHIAPDDLRGLQSANTNSAESAERPQDRVR